MIRAFRIALANWIMPKPTFVARSGTRFIREAKYGTRTMLTWADGKVVETKINPHLPQDYVDVLKVNGII